MLEDFDGGDDVVRGEVAGGEGLGGGVGVGEARDRAGGASRGGGSGLREERVERSVVPRNSDVRRRRVDAVYRRA